MINSISILGSTGSVGRQAVECGPQAWDYRAGATTNNNIELLEQQARLLKPAFVAVGNKAAAKSSAYLGGYRHCRRGRDTWLDGGRHYPRGQCGGYGGIRQYWPASYPCGH